MASLSSQVLLALGANLGDREQYLTQAVQKLGEHCGNVVKISALYATEPIGAADQSFLNAALILATDLEPVVCMRELLRIEQLLGRERRVHWGNRTIDIDIALWQNATGESLTMTTTELTIPHPRLLERDFVLVPCAEIAPDWKFPGKRKTLRQLQEDAGYTLEIHAFLMR